MFSWEVVEDMKECLEEVLIRYIKESGGVVPHPYRHYTVPKYVVDLSSCKKLGEEGLALLEPV